MPIIDFTNAKKVYKGIIEMHKIYEGSSVVWEKTEEQKDLPMYIELVNPTDSVPLQIVASGSTTKTLAYSYDNQTWTGYTASTSPYTIQLNSSNPRVYFRASVDSLWNSSSSIYWYFKKYASASDVPLKVGGNIFSLENTGDSYKSVISPRGDYSFFRIFQNFTCLTDASDLYIGTENTTLTNYCFTFAFENCTSLVNPPKLPATTLNTYCYSQMFKGCTSLVSSPELPATTLVTGCYQQMFYGCTSLNRIKCLATDISATDCTTSWVYNVASSGNFVKNMLNTSWTVGTSGIPTNWVGYSEEQETPLYIELVNSSDTVPLQVRSSKTTLSKNLYYSYDNQTWTSYTAENSPSSSITLNSSNPRVYFKAASDGQWSSTSDNDYFYFRKDPNASAVPVRVGGSVFSLENTNFRDVVNPRGTYSFLRLFYNFTCLTDASKLFLGSNASTLTSYCYSRMFYGCTALTSVPWLLPTTLASYCYQYMFYNCSSIVNVPSNLLPATTLSVFCYQYMFYGCTSLTAAPDLLAASGSDSYYRYMFYNCSSLSYIKCGAYKRLSQSGILNWVHGVAASGTFVKESRQVDYSIGDSGIPEGWTVTEYSDMQKIPFYIELCNTSQTAKIMIYSENVGSGSGSHSSSTLLKYSWDNVTWNSMTVGVSGPTYLDLNSTHPRVYFKRASGSGIFQGGISRSSGINGYRWYFYPYGGSNPSSGFNIGGNIYSLENYSFTNVNSPKSQTVGINFYKIFKDFRVFDAQNLYMGDSSSVLPDYCFGYMFQDCTYLYYTPSLPAKTLSTSCYRAMFSGCTGIQYAGTRTLPSTTLAGFCYYQMFSGCTALTDVRDYLRLPATTAAEWCYYGMFNGCTNMTKAPDLPISILANYCYNKMFYGCTKLNDIKCLATDVSATMCVTDWVNGVAATGTFTKSADMSSWLTGPDGIPLDWTVVDA